MEWLLLKGMASTKGKGLLKEWLPLKGIASTKMNGFH